MKIELTYSPECERLLKKWPNPNVDVPHLFFHLPENKGVGFDEFVRELAKLYHEKNKIQRNFNRCFISSKIRSDISHNEMGHFCDSPRNCAEFYNGFIGVFVIEITDFLKFTDSPMFNKLIDYVEKNINANSVKNDSTGESQIKFIFVVGTDDIEAAFGMYKLLKNRIRIDMVKMEYSNVKTYAEYALSLLESKGFKHETGVKEVIEKYIREMMKKESFAGFDTILRFIDDLAYETNLSILPKLTAGSLKDIKDALIKEDDDDIKQMRKIGF